MKTYTKTLMMALMAMLAFSVTSCDDDDEIAYTLEGTWEGNMYTSYYFDEYDDYYDASYSEICFVRDPYKYAKGDGYWIDYYNGYGWNRNYIASHIRWEVHNGDIWVYFIEDDYDVVIYDYSLNDSFFSGYIDLYDGSRQRFNLRHVSSPNFDNFDYGYMHNRRYSNSAKMDDTSGDVKDSVSSGKVENSGKSYRPVRIFRERE